MSQTVKVSLLGLGLMVYAGVVGYAIIEVFPRGAPTADMALALRRIADDRAREVAHFDSLLDQARKTNDTAGVRRYLPARTAAADAAIVTRLRADTVERQAIDPALVPAPLDFFGKRVADHFSAEWRFLLLAMLAGALGSFIHVAQSFSTFVGNRTFEWSWTWWYLLRPFIGAALALVVYLVFRGALVPGTSAGVANAYGVAALSALAGMFSKQAIDKLDEIFCVMFRTSAAGGDATRTDKATVSKPAPTPAGNAPAGNAPQAGQGNPRALDTVHR